MFFMVSGFYEQKDILDQYECLSDEKKYIYIPRKFHGNILFTLKIHVSRMNYFDLLEFIIKHNIIIISYPSYVQHIL